ncbi:MAG: hypothetical protein MJE77_18065 [Proteobacteria bacterium]|nr:hypothetical protein [Pseudomonadota bacterium]
MTKPSPPKNWTLFAHARDDFSRIKSSQIPYKTVHSALLDSLVPYVERAFDEASVRASYHYLRHTGFGVTEVRAIKPGHGIVGIGYFDCEDAFTIYCRRCNGTANIYAGIQPRPASFLELASNTMCRLRTGAQDRDIQWLTSLVIDVDPERPKHTASTDGELEIAIERADAIADWIESRGFVRPIRVMSGNGVHLWFAVPPYPIVRHEYDNMRQRLRAFEARIRQKFSGNGALIDSIYNPSRIIKVAGTVSIKGDPTEDRPHRTSKPLDDFVRREDPRLLRAVLCIPVAGFIPIHQPLEVPSVLDPWISTLLVVDTWLHDLFHGTGKTEADPGGHAMDRSSSGCDYSLVLDLARCGVTDPSLLAAVLMQRPDGHAAKKGTAYIERTIAKALRHAAESADKRDARPSIAVTNRDMLDLAGDAWRAISALHNDLRVYRRAGEFVQITHYAGAYRVDRLDPKSMINLLVRAARWTAANQKHVGYVFPPAQLAEFLATSAPSRESARRFGSQKRAKNRPP